MQQIRDWPLRAMGIYKIWRKYGAKGNQVIIAQPDSGFVKDEELNRANIVLENNYLPQNTLFGAGSCHGASVASVIVKEGSSFRSHNCRITSVCA